MGGDSKNFGIFSPRTLACCFAAGSTETTLNMPLITALNMRVTQGRVSWSLRDLYRGWTVTCLPYFPYKVAMFGSKNWLYDKLPYKTYDKDGKFVGIKAKEAVLVGGISGAIAACVVTPIERVQVYQNANKLKLQVALKEISQSRGILGFWTGCAGTIYRDVLFTIALFSISDYFESFMTKKSGSFIEKYPSVGPVAVSSLSRIISGAIIGGVTCPINNIKIRQQGYKAIDKATYMYAARECVKDNSLFAGLTFRIGRIALAVMYLRAAYSGMEMLFEKYGGGKY